MTSKAKKNALLNKSSYNSRKSSFIKRFYRFFWRHRDMIIEILFWIIKIFYGNGKF